MHGSRLSGSASASLCQLEGHWIESLTGIILRYPFDDYDPILWPKDSSVVLYDTGSVCGLKREKRERGVVGFIPLNVFLQNGLFPGSFVVVVFFSTVHSKYVHLKTLQMAWFEPQISTITGDRSANWATTTAPVDRLFCLSSKKFKMILACWPKPKFHRTTCRPRPNWVFTEKYWFGHCEVNHPYWPKNGTFPCNKRMLKNCIKSNEQTYLPTLVPHFILWNKGPFSASFSSCLSLLKSFYLIQLIVN